MSEMERLQEIIRDQARLIVEKNRALSRLEYRLRRNLVTNARREDLARFQLRVNKDMIEEQAELLKTILGSLSCGLLVFDRSRKIVSYNQAAKEILEVEEELLGMSCTRLFGGICARGCLLDKVREDENVKYSHEMKLQKGGGEEILLSISVTPLRDRKGNLVGGVEIFSEIPRDSQGKPEKEIPENRLSPFEPGVIAGVLKRVAGDE